MMLVFGKTGQVASELANLIPGGRFLDREAADLNDPAACAAKVMEIKPEAVILAAAYTNVDKAEEDETTAMMVNGKTPGAIALACATLGVPLVYISTDYVFDGSGEKPWAAVDETAPINVYGRSKRAGEVAVRDAGGVYAILRTSWVFSSHGRNFVKTMLGLAATRDRLSVVADQIGGPTSARSIARGALVVAGKLAEAPGLSGTYHFSGAPDVSWADFARAIFDQSGYQIAVDDIATAAYPTPARRPHNSRLDCSTLECFGLSRPDWRADLGVVLDELRVRA